MDPNLYEFSIAFLGNYSPQLIQPYWLVHKELIQEGDGEAAEIEITHPEITRFKLEWASIEVSRNKLLIRTAVESKFEVVVELMIGIHRLLRESNVHGLGINHIYHYEITDEQGDQIRDCLTPTNNWENIFDDPKLLSLEMMEFQNNEIKNGTYRLRIAPSEIMRKGVSVNINDHYDIDSESKSRTSVANEILGSNWKRSLDESVDKVKEIWKRVF
ncbi:hypothetical protein [Ekhidna sp.]|uniref:hypothetical protein n=1 Tax=Ekhidna sp. TaxID=2608089 RepID=UPI003B5AC887